MSYKEQLKHPNWQRKRLEIMQRDNFKCRICGDTKKQLHVHHIFYENEADNIWNYPNESLITLCSDCHKYEHELNLFDQSLEIFKKIVLVINEPLSMIDIDLIIYQVTMDNPEIDYKEAIKLAFKILLNI